MLILAPVQSGGDRRVEFRSGEPDRRERRCSMKPVKERQPTDPLAYEIWRLRRRFETHNTLMAMIVVLLLVLTGISIAFLIWTISRLG